MTAGNATDATTTLEHARQAPARSGETQPGIEDVAATLCATCPHPWGDHDQIAVRYCTATTKATDPGSRGCVCTTKET
jgi:hypothetical protein